MINVEIKQKKVSILTILLTLFQIRKHIYPGIEIDRKSITTVNAGKF